MDFPKGICRGASGPRSTYRLGTSGVDPIVTSEKQQVTQPPAEQIRRGLFAFLEGLLAGCGEVMYGDTNGLILDAYGVGFGSKQAEAKEA